MAEVINSKKYVDYGAQKALVRNADGEIGPSASHKITRLRSAEPRYPK